jgi:ketosteroid isomerase-like protein
MRHAFRVSILMAVCASLVACTVWSERPSNHIGQATGAEALERTFWNEVKIKHWTELEQHFAINYVGDTPEGKEDRAAAVQRFHRMILRDFSIADMQTELNGTTFIVSYSIALQGELDGRPLASPLRVMTVWQHEKSGWIIIGRSVANKVTAALGPPRIPA